MSDMQKHNPYAASAAVTETPDATNDGLASRWQRFWAALIDGLILGAVIWGGLFGAMGVTPSAFALWGFGSKLMMGVVGFVLFLAVNGFFLQRDGQTVGKKLIGIRIVRTDGSRADLAHLILRRYLPVHVVQLVPVVGGLGGLIDALFIYNKDKRCLHDLIADTKVIVA